MATVRFTETLRRHYEYLFDTCLIRPEKTTAVYGLVAKLRAHEARYRKVSERAGVPWGFVAAEEGLRTILCATQRENLFLFKGLFFVDSVQYTDVTTEKIWCCFLYENVRKEA